MEADLVYYRRRSAEEAAAAMSAADPKVRQIHLELASRYNERIADFEADALRAPLRLVSTA
jgi:transposase-like protein